MEYLFFITLTLLFVALFFVWKFWRERNMYCCAYRQAMDLVNSTSRPEGLLPAIVRGAAIGILVGTVIKLLSRRFAGEVFYR